MNWKIETEKKWETATKPDIISKAFWVEMWTHLESTWKAVALNLDPCLEELLSIKVKARTEQNLGNEWSSNLVKADFQCL